MIYIIVLNYNNYLDTILCLESLLKLDYKKFKIIVIDNASKNDSVKKLINWADCNFKINFIDIESYCDTIKNNILPVNTTPVSYKCYSQKILKKNDYIIDFDCEILFIKNSENEGFSAGNNEGIKVALKQNDVEGVWLLNNDTIVKNDSLSKLISKIKQNNNIGICGSSLLYINNPSVVQVYGGGHYCHKNGTVINYGALSKYDSSMKEDQVLQNINYICGASCFITKACLIKNGLFNSEYFLYFEEKDYTEKILKNNFGISIAIDSIVYHKEGGSVGSNAMTVNPFAKYHFNLSRLIFTKNFYPKSLPFIFLRTLASSTIYLLKGKPLISISILKALKDFILHH